jgi:hypothetical protein
MLEIGDGSTLNQNAAIKQYANMILSKKPKAPGGLADDEVQDYR